MRGLQGVGDMTAVISMILLPLAVLMCAYAMMVFLWRGGRIAQKQVAPLPRRLRGQDHLLRLSLHGRALRAMQRVADLQRWSCKRAGLRVDVLNVGVFTLACCLQVGYIDDQRGPVCLAAVVVLALSAIFAVSLVDFIQQLNHNSKA